MTQSQHYTETTMTADYEALWGETWGGMQDIGPVHRHNRQIIVDLIRPLGVALSSMPAAATART